MNKKRFRPTVQRAVLHISLVLLLFSWTTVHAQRPNILWITIEDTSPQFIGCYGNEQADTPVIDQLAREGVRFTNAFSTGTVCSTSRSTLITGVPTYKMGTGNHRSNYPIPDAIKGFPFYMQQQGYYVTNNSKTDYNLENEKQFIQETWDESSNEAGWWNRAEGQPFFAVFNFIDSHQSRTMTNPYSWYKEEVLGQLPPGQQIGEEEFEMPPFYADNPEMRKQMARVYNSIKLTDNKIGQLLERLKQDKLLGNTIIFFFADHGEGIPRGKTNGINLGYRVPFITYFPPAYQHLSTWKSGTVSSELLDFEDLAPSMISLAGGELPDHLKGRVIWGEGRNEAADQLFLSSDRSDNGIDMVRTVTNGTFVYSRNYMPYLPEARYIRYMEIGDIKQQMRNDLQDQKLNPLQQSLFEERAPEVLYDIEKDLWETHNLVDDPLAQPLLQKMRHSLKSNILQTRDVMFLPEYEIAELSQFTTPYEFRLDEEEYPLEEIYAAAKLAGYREEGIAAQQVKLLQSPNKIIRYWAGIGLRSQNPANLKPYRFELLQALKDEYPPVVITAAAIAYDLFKDKTAEELLKQYCGYENKHLALMAINYLLYVDQPEPFIATIQQINQRENLDYNLSAASKDFLGSLGLIPNNFEYK